MNILRKIKIIGVVLLLIPLAVKKGSLQASQNTDPLAEYEQKEAFGENPESPQPELSPTETGSEPSNFAKTRRYIRENPGEIAGIAGTLGATGAAVWYNDRLKKQQKAKVKQQTDSAIEKIKTILNGFDDSEKIVMAKHNVTLLIQANALIAALETPATTDDGDESNGSSDDE